MERILEITLAMLSFAEYNAKKLNARWGKPKTPEESFLRNMEFSIYKCFAVSIVFEFCAWRDINRKARENLGKFRQELVNLINSLSPRKSVAMRLREIDRGLETAIRYLRNMKGAMESKNVPKIEECLWDCQDRCRQCRKSLFAKRQNRMSPERAF